MKFTNKDIDIISQINANEFKKTRNDWTYHQNRKYNLKIKQIIGDVENSEFFLEIIVYNIENHENVLYMIISNDDYENEKYQGSKVYLPTEGLEKIKDLIKDNGLLKELFFRTSFKNLLN